MSGSLAAVQRRFAARLAQDDRGEGGLAVYRRGVEETRHTALAAAYPVVRRLVGDAFFREAASQYARAHPSVSGDLHAFGAHLADFLRGYPYAASLAYLPDVARLEWAVHRAQHAADAPRFDFAALERVPPQAHPALRLLLAPSVGCVASQHAIHSLWEANQPQRDGTPNGNDAQSVLVWREEGVVRARVVDEAEWQFLAALGRGAPLSEAQDALGDSAGERLAALLARYAAEGVVCGFRTAGE